VVEVTLREEEMSEKWKEDEKGTYLLLLVTRCSS
jgi:hypothetical protein